MKSQNSQISYIAKAYLVFVSYIFIAYCFREPQKMYVYVSPSK